MRIRQITIDDENIISEIEEGCFNEKERATREKIKNRIKVFGDSFLLLESDEDSIGYIGGMKIDNKILKDEMYANPLLHNPKGKYQSIFSLCVKKDYRGKGYGKILMEGIIEKSKQDNLDGVVLTCKEKYIKFYESLGFKSFGISESCHGGATWYDMFLQI